MYVAPWATQISRVVQVVWAFLVKFWSIYFFVWTLKIYCIRDINIDHDHVPGEGGGKNLIFREVSFRHSIIMLGTFRFIPSVEYFWNPSPLPPSSLLFLYAGFKLFLQPELIIYLALFQGYVRLRQYLGQALLLGHTRGARFVARNRIPKSYYTNLS